ncbi:MAG: selenocysteine-specific translation elongation factor, partial [Proteobacteria bacterium]|nr:selenocysteine-specific translation elongation factor [Pseudomonadota bacterium]
FLGLNLEEWSDRVMDKFVTVGIAGHVDHGKTSLVKAMTGIDTDRLQEEKRRGLSIESGIAPMGLSSGESVALVDVPGHTDFLKNTIRGLSGVDAAVLVVAADDGVMPQTREHIEILRFFGAETGFVVLNKADLVDEETLDLAELEVRELLEGSFLENSPIIPFSAVDRRGLDEIRTEIECLVEASPGKDVQAPFRLWIDQVKSFSGFGTVVSGTVASGKLVVNNPVQILPSGIETRARSLESHHHKINQVAAGQRAGVNLHKISANEVSRGMVLAEPGFITPGYILNVDIQALGSAKSSIKNRQRVKLYLGTSVTNALVVLMDKENLAPGEEGLAQLRLMKPVVAIPGDPFVICPLNIQSIMGGGRALEITWEKY